MPANKMYILVGSSSRFNFEPEVFDESIDAVNRLVELHKELTSDKDILVLEDLNLEKRYLEVIYTDDSYEKYNIYETYYEVNYLKKENVI